jgi:uncharacterized protein YbjT (DUF2867 family)
MRIAVTTPTGNIGSVVTDRLLEAGAEVVLLARHPDKVKSFVDRGATVIAGSLRDMNTLREATHGVDALFWLTPPDYQAENVRASQLSFGESAVGAIKANRIPRVVNLSSYGAHLESGTGPVRGLAEIERKLDRVAANVTHLRPTAFMENILTSLETIRSSRSIFLPVSGKTPVEMIATRDIGEFAAKRLLDDSWNGRHVIELFGPKRHTFDEAASLVSEAVGETVTHVPVPPEAAREAMTGMGISADAANGILEIYAGFEDRRLLPDHEPPSEARTPTTFAEFSRDVIAPMAKGSPQTT